MNMELVAVTTTLSWINTQSFTNVCFLGDSMGMLRRILIPLITVGVSETVNFVGYRFHFIFVLGYAVVKR
jgi:hypothetical protein